MEDLVRPFRRRVAQLEGGGAAAERDAQRAAARGDARHLSERYGHLQIAAGELQHGGFEPRLARRRRPLEARGDLCFIPHVASPSTTRSAGPVENARSRSAAWSAESPRR